MIPKRKLNLPGILLMSLTFAFITTSCNNDNDIPKDPEDAVTLNMMDELNGKTPLGGSNVYINKANNFYSSSSFIADAGSSKGIGENIPPKLNNLVNEAAVIPGHLYQVFDKRTMRDFPSGTRAVEIEANYYHVYVVSPIINTDNVSTGAMVKYISVYPDPNGLPEIDRDLGILYYEGDIIEMDLLKDAEYALDEYGANALRLSTSDGKLVITLDKTPSNISGPYGTYRIYIRQGNVFSTVKVNVE